MKHGHVAGVVAERDIGTRVDDTRPTKGRISRPDATIWGPGFAVVVEAKVHGGLDNEQLERLRSGPTGISEAPLPVVPDVGWNVLYQDLRALLHRTDSGLSEKEAWLTRQFCSYLECTMMAGFIGFNEDFFDHFTFEEQADDESRRSVLAALGGVSARLTESPAGTSLLSELDPDWAVDIGPLTRSDRHAWIAIGAPEKRYRQRPHVSLIFGRGGIHVQANIELKDAVVSLRRALDAAPAETLEKMLGATADDPAASIEVMERKQRQAMLYDYFPRATLDLQTLRDPAVQAATFAYFQALVHTLPLPYVTIRRCIPRRDCMDVSRSDTSGRAITELIVDHIRRVTPLVQHLDQY